MQQKIDIGGYIDRMKAQRGTPSRASSSTPVVRHRGMQRARQAAQASQIQVRRKVSFMARIERSTTATIQKIDRSVASGRSLNDARDSLYGAADRCAVLASAAAGF